ncbi:uncharacterized protein MONOS_9154 [Monocercomonoides exilis]|uniref:uncharacterized protein n=1 Tax=Monocercomonoides exilis TaxID=2049356 RepID=UPI0035594F07|nr:hypothetical protein MONOS_9154 [Monocercomonoides exilis]|eukprot:MONOS_9154.1-p1 / transcript=MONOS_9154.1 / gene=MONOS_9154 / organism=Monocercomonoides_exilis_PA203 / gene_product=unspecified product / transcript_product=unspecified product / location=Mono_scaffold00369:15295-16200(+) / protein_length=302 / sequence_SO=supercontig / SO=protein_coding / is_pseudo=false
MIFVFQIFTPITAQTVNAAEIYAVYVKQSGSDTNTGTAIGQEKKSLNSAYDLLGEEEACKIYVINDTTALTAETLTLNKNQGITIEGINSDGNGNTMVAIDCDVNSKGNLFTCNGDTEYKFFAFHFPLSLGGSSDDSLICISNCNLTIRNCQFIRPTSNGGTVGNCLVYVDGGNLYMINVECVDEIQNVSFSCIVYYAINSHSVTLTNVTMKKISSSNSIVCTNGGYYDKLDMALNNCTFTECQTRSNGILYVSSYNGESTFAIGDGGVTSFTSCSSSGYDTKSGGIYLSMSNIMSSSQLK